MKRLHRFVALVFVLGLLSISAYAAPRCPTQLTYFGSNPTITDLYGTTLPLFDVSGNYTCTYAGGYVVIDVDSNVPPGDQDFYAWDGESLAHFLGNVPY